MPKQSRTIDLPGDVLDVLEASSHREVDEQVRIALSLDLFARRAVSLAKAAELAGVDRQEMLFLLRERGRPAYEYDSQAYEQDCDAQEKFRRLQEAKG